VSRHALVLERGRVVHDGPSAALLAEPDKLAKLVAVA
jgi:ABC-type branched-subunit amino acid transport system ATPase component